MKKETINPLKIYLENQAGLFRQTQKKLEAVNGSEDVRQYGDAFGYAQCMKLVTGFQKAAREYHNQFVHDTWPAHTREKQERAAQVLRIIQSGGPKRTADGLSDSQLHELGFDHTTRMEYTQRTHHTEALLAGLSQIGLQLSLQNAFTIYSMMSTEAIEQKVGAYLATAKDAGAFDGAFDFKSWQTDRIVLPLVLGKRAANNDARAALLLENTPEFVNDVERTIQAQSVEPDGQAEFFLQAIEDVLDDVVKPGADGRPAENMAAAETLFGLVERQVLGIAPEGLVANTPPATTADIPVAS
jgi:hypothetical protein